MIDVVMRHQSKPQRRHPECGRKGTDEIIFARAPAAFADTCSPPSPQP